MVILITGKIIDSLKNEDRLATRKSRLTVFKCLDLEPLGCERFVREIERTFHPLFAFHFSQHPFSSTVLSLTISLHFAHCLSSSLCSLSISASISVPNMSRICVFLEYTFPSSPFSHNLFPCHHHIDGKKKIQYTSRSLTSGPETSSFPSPTMSLLLSSSSPFSFLNLSVDITFHSFPYTSWCLKYPLGSCLSSSWRT